MMSDSDFRILRDLIAEDALVLTESDEHGKGTLILKEEGGSATYSLMIRRVPDNALAIKADRFPEPRFRGDRGERKRADFIIVAATGKKKWIVYIELKAGKTPSRAVKQQLMGAECLLAYCRAVGRTFWQQTGFLDRREYNQRFVCVSRINVNKKPTRSKRTPAVHDTPENMLRIESPNGTLQFNRLVRGDADVG